MKRNKFLICLLVALLAISVVVVAACDLINSEQPDTPDVPSEPSTPEVPETPTDPKDPETPNAPEIVGISVFGPIEAYVDEFSYDDYTITVFYSNKTTKSVPLSASYLSSADQVKLTTVGTHTVMVTYEGVSALFSVKLRHRGYDISGIVFESAIYTYDGKPHSIEVQGNLPSGVTVSYVGNAQTNAGTYTVTAKFSGVDGEPLPDMMATPTRT